MDVLDDMFEAWRADVDSEPFAHEAAVAGAIDTSIPVTPGGGAGCPIVLGVLIVGALALVVFVAQVVMAVWPW